MIKTNVFFDFTDFQGPGTCRLGEGRGVFAQWCVGAVLSRMEEVHAAVPPPSVHVKTRHQHHRH